MLEVEGLVAGYGRGAAVLQGVALAAGAGERLAIMGRNGVGKTLLARTLIGLVRPAAGRIRFRGGDIAGLPAHRISNLGIGYVPQGRDLFADFSVLDNLRMGVIGRPRGESLPLERVFAWFPILAERARQRAGTLSGGEGQQLAIARALIGRPRLLLLDEPSEGIQPNIVHMIGETLARICGEERLTVIVIEQNFDLVETLAERVAFLDGGRITAELPAAALAADRALIQRHMGL